MKNEGSWGRVLGQIFGNVTWSAPPWLSATAAGLAHAGGAMRNHPRAVVSALVGAAVLTVSVWLPWSWWQSHRPRQLSHNVVRQVELAVTLPPAAVAPGTSDEDFSPSPLRIAFRGAPVAPQEKIGREVKDAAVLSPALPGIWVWVDGSTLEFRPQAAWPPGTELTVRIQPKALARDVALDTDRKVITTPPLVARISSFTFYNSPKDPAVYQLVGELLLSHPVDDAQLRQALGMQVLGGTPLFAAGKPQLTLSADPKSVRRYFVRSQPIGVPAKEDWVKLTLAKGLVSKLGGQPLQKAQETKTRVPDKYSGLKITGASTRIIRTEEGEPEQVLFVQTDQAIDSAQIARRIALWWHPHRWHSDHDKLDFAGRVGEASRIALTPVESEAPLSTSHAFRFTEPRTHGSALLRIERGAQSPGGFEINLDYERVISLPAFPKETRILGKGNVLALHGERKLLVQSRGIDHLRITLGRVPIEQFQHLIATTGYSEFSDPSFEDDGFSENNLVQRWSKVIEVNRKNEWEATRSEVDLAQAPPIAQEQPGGRGVFFVLVEPVKRKEVEVEGNDVHSRVEEPYLYTAGEDRSRSLWYGSRSFDPGDGWEPSGEETAERFLMVTDLGLLVKAGADDTRDVFVMSLAQGAPVAGVQIRAIARNGSTLHSAVTDANGQARLPDFDGMVGERLPIAVLALKDGDVSFLPFNERQLPAMDYSRFDIDGVVASRIKALESFIFTERGVYRPGDTVHAGVITRRRDWQPVLEGLPLAITLSDPQGRSMGRQLVRLPYDGFFACDFQVPETANLGVYDIEVDVLDAEGHYRFRLGSGHVRVEEFQPDRMKVVTRLDPEPPPGWIDSAQTTAEVSVRSLFDEPAPERRVSMKLELTPASFGFKEWPGYSFYDRAAASSISSAGRVVELGEQTTDEEGKASFELPLNTFDAASFHMAVLTEAFERDGGRSVRHATSVLVSSFDHVIGTKADVDLDTLTKDADCALDLVAVGRDLKSVGLDELRLRVISIRQVSVLTQHENGNYAYVSTAKESTLSEQPFAIAEGGVRWKPPTGVPGKFRMELVDAEGSLHCVVPFQVVGKGDPGIALDRATELGLQLSKGEALPGEEIEVFLTAPYIGAGLITIEREKVVASQWFQTDAKSSSVKLRIPAGLEGTYYINAAYV
ncbi:MAG TPA: MG2 domain-containing protein, partial [Luteolibacter sp.]|nr:MG2 domain-containing protein [Luteolibacter sp.]